MAEFEEDCKKLGDSLIVLPISKFLYNGWSSEEIKLFEKNFMLAVTC